MYLTKLISLIPFLWKAPRLYFLQELLQMLSLGIYHSSTLLSFSMYGSLKNGFMGWFYWKGFVDKAKSVTWKCIGLPYQMV